MAEDSRLDNPEEPKYFVRVTGFSTNTTQDALLNFFENTRRSGGGEIKEIQIKFDKGFADIIFCSNDDAERVVKNKGLRLDGACLTTTLKPIPKELPKDQKSLHVKGISNSTIRDGLVAFMEVVSRKEVESIIFGDNRNCVVSFMEPIDFRELQRICKTYSMNDSFLGIEQVIVCDSIEVSGFTENTNKDTIMYYFRNKRNGGGDVKSIEIVKEGKAVLSFEDPEVVDTLLRQAHVIDGAHLVLSRFYPFLGETSSNNPNGEKRERPVQVDPQIMQFICEFFHQEFDQLLQKHHVKYTGQQGAWEIVLGCTDPNMDKKTWENSCEAVVAYIHQIGTETIRISQEIWEQMSHQLTEKCAGLAETQMQVLHSYDFLKKQNSVFLRGKKTDVCALSKELHDLVSRVEEQIMFEKSKVTKKIALSQAQMELMSLCGFVEDVKSKYEELEIETNSGEHTIQMRGQEDVVNEGSLAIWQKLAEMKETELKLDGSVIDVLASEKGQAFLSNMLKSSNIEAVVCSDSKLTELNLFVTAVDRKNMKEAVSLIEDAISEESIHLDADHEDLIESEEWRNLKDSIQKMTLLKLTEEKEENKVSMVGFKQDVDSAKEQIEEFFKTNTTMKKVEAEAESVINDIAADDLKGKDDDCVEITMPCDFIELNKDSLVSAKLDSSRFTVDPKELNDLFTKAKKQTAVVEFLEVCDGFMVSGSLEQIDKTCRFLSRYAKPPDPRPFRESSDDLQNSQHDGSLFNDSDDEDKSLETIVLEPEPKLMYLLQRELNEIENKYEMKIDWKSEPGKAHLIPNGKNADLFEQGKEEFISLYQEELQNLQEKDFPIDTAKNTKDVDSTVKSLMAEFAVVIERKGDNILHIFGKESLVAQVMQRLQDRFGKRRTRSWAYKNPGKSTSVPTSKEFQECGLCYEQLDVAQASKICDHLICKECVTILIKIELINSCPICHKPAQVAPQPLNGQMKSGVIDGSLPGHENCATIYIDYDFPEGIQGPFHPNPGSPYDELSRRTFLPDNEEGREVLKLLQKAFDACILFTVGKSTISEKDNQIIFNVDIEQKINIDGGPSVGYPDQGYLDRVKKQLKAKGIE